MKALLLKLHRWIGLASGAIVVIVCLSGAALVFEPQFVHTTDPALRPAFFRVMQHLHTRLLDDEFGEWLVMGSTIAFVVTLVFSVVIWWPRTLAALRTRTTLAKVLGPGVSLKRRNYDLHVAVGIYTVPVLLILGMTGLMFDGDLFTSERYKDLIHALHLGTVGGLTTEIIAFVAALLAASFPITGFIMWWPRWSRQRRHLPPPPTERELPSILEE